MDNQAIFGQNKILNHPDKIKCFLGGENDTLITAEIDMTNICNNRCPGCTGWHIKKTQDSLTLKEAKDYLAQLKLAGAKAIIFTGGGEPLMNPSTPEALHYAKALGFDIGFITNGHALNRKNMTDILSTCKWCRISLDAGGPEMYKKTHGMEKEDFGRVVVMLRRLCLLKKEIKSECTIGSAYLTGKNIYDYTDMDNFVQFSKWAGVDYAQFRPFHRDFTDVSKDIKKLQKKYGEWVTGSWHKYIRMGEKKLRPYDTCYGVNFATVVGADANVYICCHMRGRKEYSLGSLREKSFKEIWENRGRVFKNIDFKDCPPLCRCDEFNRVLFELKKPKQHINFL